MNIDSVLVLFVSVSVGLALGARILFTRGRSPIDLRRCARAALAIGALLLVQVLLLRLLHRSFLLINVVYLHTMVLVPLLGLLLLAARKRRTIARPVLACAWASLILIPIGIDASFIEPFRLVEERATIALATARSGDTPLSICVLADIQCMRVTDREREVVARAMAHKPDLILLPGDLVQLADEDLEREIPALRELLAPLDAPLGAWIVLGNTDLESTTRRIVEGTHVELLHNRIVTLTHGDRHVTLGGVDLTFDSAAARKVLRELEADPRADDVRLLLAHRPDVMFALEHPSRVDLVIAGHTHGGQVQIPFFGPPITLSDVPRAIAAGGFHRADGVPIYVSRGIGCEHGDAPRVRFLCPPELSLLTLVPPSDEDALLAR